MNSSQNAGVTRYLRSLVFVCGMVTLGAEMSASRLLAPYFGTSLPVWSSLIGLILLALALGYTIGGRVADRWPKPPTLVAIVAAAGICLVLLPFVSQPILKILLSTLVTLNLGVLLGSFVSVIVLLGIPMILLGCVTPYAVRLATADVAHAGRAAGSLFAWSTVGSVIGAFLPVMVLIPTVGTRLTIMIFGGLLLLMAALGFVMCRYRKVGVATLLLLAGVYPAAQWMSATPIKSGENVLFEGESPYQYVRVTEDAAGWRALSMNEGFVTHSKYHPLHTLTFGEWDFFAVAPYFNPAPYDPLSQVKRWGIIGLGAGTTARLVSLLYGPIQIDGVEIDPMVVAVGREFFELDRPNLNVTIQDGRAWMATTPHQYDVIAIDAYRQPYIPFELSTVEFFQQVHDHLGETGVVCINVAEPNKDRRLVNALAATMDQVFPSVFVLRLRDRSNATLVIGTKSVAGVEDFASNAARAQGVLGMLTAEASTRVEAFSGSGRILTDDCAPVERLMDLMILRVIQKTARSGA